MGWIVCLVLVIVSLATKDTSFLVPAGLFAIAGEIGCGYTALTKKKDK